MFGARDTNFISNGYDYIINRAHNGEHARVRVDTSVFNVTALIRQEIVIEMQYVVFMRHT